MSLAEHVEQVRNIFIAPRGKPRFALFNAAFRMGRGGTH
jgi:hypothetical protein